MIVGRTFSELVDAWMNEMVFDSSEERRRFREERLSRKRFEQVSTCDVRLRDGRRLRVADRPTPEGGIVKTIWDLTDDERQAEELRHARELAEAASEAKSEFLSSMSHELRTPLNAILGFAQLLARDRKEPLSARHKERLAHILHGGEHLLRLIDDVLDLARIESGRVSIFAEPISVTAIIEAVLQTLAPMAAQNEITLEIASPEQALPPVRVDRTRFAQILMNFGSNAVKYNRAGGRVSFEAVAVDEGYVRITVSDTGIGIPAESHDKIFQPFQRAGQETGPIEGTGIGLSITKRLVEMMGGEVGFRSTEGEGSSFWVDMPVAVARERARAEAAADRSSERLLEGAVFQVLYVEDNPANVIFMRDLMSSFERVDFAVVTTAERGIEYACAHRPDLILMDINLPGMSGVDALRALRGIPETAAIPVIALTAAASERDRRQGIEAGFFRYLTKPVKVDELIGAIEALLPS